MYDEGVRDGAENFYLVDDMVSLFRLDDLIFFHDLDAAIFIVFFVLDQLDLSE